jgi:hypothetical protein
MDSIVEGQLLLNRPLYYSNVMRRQGMQMPCDHSLNQRCVATLKAKNELDSYTS